MVRNLLARSKSPSNFLALFRGTAISVALPLVALFTLFGCDFQPIKMAESPTFASGEVFKESGNATFSDEYRVDGTPVEVEVKSNSNGLDRIIIVESHGKTLEKEQYRITAKKFELIEAAGERFSTPIPLLEFPLRIGDQYDWKGKLVTNSGSVPADAVITTENRILSRKDKSDQAVLVTVKLKLEKEETDRRLSLWFIPKEGLVRREFGTCVRERN